MAAAALGRHCWGTAQNLRPIQAALPFFRGSDKINKPYSAGLTSGTIQLNPEPSAMPGGLVIAVQLGRKEPRNASHYSYIWGFSSCR